MTTDAYRAVRRRGVVVPFVAVIMLVLLGMAALTVDLGHLHNTHAEMQRAVDAAALAGASGLLEGEEVMRIRAYELAESNLVDGSPVQNEEVEVTAGNWEWFSREFTPGSTPGGRTPNAVRIVASRDTVSLFFANAVGMSGADVGKAATALLGSGRCAGIWGLDSIQGNGSIVTDSYDSQSGAYGSGNIRPNGDICSCGDLELAGSAEIHGDAMYGSGYGYQIHGDASSVWGVIDEHPCAVNVPEFDMNDARRRNDNDTIGLTDAGRDPFRGRPGSLSIVENDNLTLAAGRYYFRSVTLVGQATLTVTGPTEIYIWGDAKFGGGGIINAGQDPSDLIIYSTGNDLELGGSAGFYGAVIAPTTTVKLTGTGGFYGTIVGQTLDINGTAEIHVDEFLVSSLYGLGVVSPVLVE